MPQKIDVDSTSGEKLLRLFRKLMIEGRRHFQVDLAKEFQCSTQTIIRLISEIENVVGIALESGIENRKKWYRMKSLNRARLGLDFEELRYLALCRDMAQSILPQNILERVDNTLLELSILMADKDFDVRERVQEEQFPFFSKGKIDYSLFFNYIETLQKAIENKHFCLLRYKPAGKEERECRFAPSRIIAMNKAHVNVKCNTRVKIQQVTANSDIFLVGY